MRWKAIAVGMALALAGALGCKQQCFVTEPDLEHYRNIGIQALDCAASSNVLADPFCGPPPSTVLDPEREPRYISLAECIAQALESGTIGAQSFFGSVNFSLTESRYLDIGLSFRARALADPDAIRVLALDPAIAYSDIEAALSKFDARWNTSMSWSKADRPIGTNLDTFQSRGLGVGFIDLNDAAFSTSLLKPLPTGGVAGITFRTDYELSNLQPRVNPSYRPAIQFQFEQPLLQGFGVEINQLRASHPGSILTPFNNTSRVEGILISRIRFDQARAEFERNVNFQLINVEYTYWQLYGLYWTLYSREQALRQAFEAWRINKARYEAGKIPITDFAQTRGQYELFRSQRLQALGDVLEKERELRGLMGLPVEDGTRLVPADSPTLAPFKPDWCTAVNDAMNMRPELVLARNDLKARQLEVINQKNLLLPDLRFFSTYDFNSVGSQIDGNDGTNAFRNLADGNFSNWSLGLRADIPLGFRDAHAAVRNARLNLARSYAILRDQESRAAKFVELQYRAVIESYEQILTFRAQREAYGTQLKARFAEFLAGKGTLDFLLEAQRNWADALRGEYEQISRYNVALAGFQFAKGTIMDYDNVHIAEGPLPQCAQVRAVEHIRERDKGLVIRERALPHPHPAGHECSPDAVVPDLPTNEAGPVPTLIKKDIPLIDAALPGEGTGIKGKARPAQLPPADPSSDRPAEKPGPRRLPNGPADKGPTQATPSDQSPASGMRRLFRRPQEKDERQPQGEMTNQNQPTPSTTLGNASSSQNQVASPPGQPDQTSSAMQRYPNQPVPVPPPPGMQRYPSNYPGQMAPSTATQGYPSNFQPGQMAPSNYQMTPSAGTQQYPRNYQSKQAPAAAPGSSKPSPSASPKEQPAQDYQGPSLPAPDPQPSESGAPAAPRRLPDISSSYRQP